jgi:hypothetical protein
MAIKKRPKKFKGTQYPDIDSMVALVSEVPKEEEDKKKPEDSNEEGHVNPKTSDVRMKPAEETQRVPLSRTNLTKQCI